MRLPITANIMYRIILASLKVVMLSKTFIKSHFFLLSFNAFLRMGELLFSFFYVLHSRSDEMMYDKEGPLVGRQPSLRRSLLTFARLLLGAVCTPPSPFRLKSKRYVKDQMTKF